MKVDYVIVGGGMAGLCAALTLAEKGASPLLIEAGGYPCHKVCGEFISPNTVPILNRWNIFPTLIRQVHFRTATKTCTFNFSSPAGSLSHLQLDPALAREAEQRGARILTHTRVESMRLAEQHELVLSDGQTISVKHLLVATGRIPSLRQEPLQAVYLGFKAHFRGIALESSLEMFSSMGMYLGLSPVEDGLFNMAGIARLPLAQQAGSVDSLIASMRQVHPVFDGYMNQAVPVFKEWMQVSVPEFGLKKTPSWPRTYFIGDAALTVPPACGNGLSLAIQSGCLAAEYALVDDPSGFKNAWHRQVKSQLFFDKLLHQALLRPAWGSVLIHLARWSPSLATGLYRLTRS